MVQDRRRFMKQAALVGTAAWAAPAVITLDAAAAQGSVTPPVQVGGQSQVGTGSGTGGTGVLGKTATNTPTAVKTQVRGTQLARTGVDTKLMVAGGAAAVAAGTAMHLWSTDLDGRATAQRPTSE